MVNPLDIVYGNFCAIVAEMSSCNRDYMVCKTKNNYCLVPYRKSWLTPDLDIGFFVDVSFCLCVHLSHLPALPSDPYT